MQKLAASIKANLTPDLLKPEYRNNPKPFAGYCYVASEVYYHLRGGKAAGLTPMCTRHEGSTHWWINDNGEVVDLTAEQFETPVDYSKGKGCGFLTKKPSRRAQEVIRRMYAN